MSRLVVVLAAVALVVPATAQADLLAAYERVTTTAQLDIALVNASTGLPVALAAGVNTPAREFHPSLSPDARRLTFVRQTFERRGSDQILQAVNRICQAGIASLQVGKTGSNIGIYVQRVRGTGRRARLRFARRVPLGYHRPGRFRIRLPRLSDGTYQLVARTLTASGKVKDVSAPIRVAVRHGKYRRVAGR